MGYSCESFLIVQLPFKGIMSHQWAFGTSQTTGISAPWFMQAGEIPLAWFTPCHEAQTNNRG